MALMRVCSLLRLIANLVYLVEIFMIRENTVSDFCSKDHAKQLDEEERSRYW